MTAEDPQTNANRRFHEAVVSVPFTLPSGEVVIEEVGSMGDIYRFSEEHRATFSVEGLGKVAAAVKKFADQDDEEKPQE